MLKGLHIRLNQRLQRLEFLNFPDPEPQHTLTLPFEAHRFDPDHWLQSGRHVVLIQQDTHKKADEIGFQPLEMQGDAGAWQELLLSPLGTFFKTIFPL